MESGTRTQRLVLAFRLQGWGPLGFPPCCHHCQVTRASGGSSRTGLAVLSRGPSCLRPGAPGLELELTVCQDPWPNQSPLPLPHLGKAASTVWVPRCQVMTVPIMCPLLGAAATCLSLWQTWGTQGCILRLCLEVLITQGERELQKDRPGSPKRAELDQGPDRPFQLHRAQGPGGARACGC